MVRNGFGNLVACSAANLAQYAVTTAPNTSTAIAYKWVLDSHVGLVKYPADGLQSGSPFKASR